MTERTKLVKPIACGPALLSALTLTAALAVPRAAAADGDWVTPMWAQALGAPMPSFVMPEPTPRFIHQFEQQRDASGWIASFQPGGATVTADNAFFAPLGTNGRTCFTCHQPQHGWSFGPESVLSTFIATRGQDPLFAPVDGADCPSLVDDDDGHHGGGDDAHHRDGHWAARFVGARTQLFTKSNIRIFLPVPADAEYQVRIVRDPYGCETSPEYGLPAGFLSMYRRMRASANVAALEPNADGETFSIMWDGREPSLESQFVDATLGHAQAAAPPTAEQQAEGASFQRGLFSAQIYDDRARSLRDGGASGGPEILSTLSPSINGLNISIPGLLRRRRSSISSPPG